MAQYVHGPTTINRGTLNLNSSLSGSNIAVTGGTMAESSTGSIGGTGTTLTITGGTATLAGANAFTGGTSVTAGTLTISNQLALQNSTLTLAGGSVAFGSSVTAATVGGLAGTGNISLQNSIPAAVALTVGGNNASTVYAGVLSGSGSLIKTGSGTLNLFAANTYTGTTTVGGTGTLRLAPAPKPKPSWRAPTRHQAFQPFSSSNFTAAPASTNLIRGLSPVPATLVNTQAGQTGTGGLATGGVAKLTDGAESNTGNNTTDLAQIYTIGSSALLTYVLGSTPAPDGYSLSKINIYSEWADNGRSQITLSDIAYSTVANPTVFTNLTNARRELLGRRRRKRGQPVAHQRRSCQRRLCGPVRLRNSAEYLGRILRVGGGWHPDDRQ